MLSSQHVFSHQHQYQAEPSWLHQQQSHHQQQHPHHISHQNAQAQAAAAAAAVAQQNHYNRIASSNNNNGHNHNGPGAGADVSITNGMDGNITDDFRRVLVWVADLLNGNSRETALMELSKKREQVSELALIIWHSFGIAANPPPSFLDLHPCPGVMTSLLQEIISVYPLLNPSQLTAAASNRVCNALALLQCVASHNETRALFLHGK